MLNHNVSANKLQPESIPSLTSQMLDEEDQTKLDEISSYVAKELNLQTELAKKVLFAALMNIKVLDGKQLDYGSANLRKFGPYGVLVRLNDKVERLANLKKRIDDGNTVKNETVADTWLDSANYSLIGFVMEDGLWK